MGFRERGCSILRKELYVLKDSRNDGFSEKLLEIDGPTCDLFYSDVFREQENLQLYCGRVAVDTPTPPRRTLAFLIFSFHTPFLGILCGVSSLGIYNKQLMFVKALDITGLAANINLLLLLLLSSLIKERTLNAPFQANLTSSVNSAKGALPILVGKFRFSGGFTVANQLRNLPRNAGLHYA